MAQRNYLRRVIRITAEDSPNVRAARAAIAQELDPHVGTTVTAGVLTWEEYQIRRKVWDEVRQCVGLDAQFYEGAELLLFPPEWLNRAERLADSLSVERKAEAIGIDPAEGGDRTAMAAIDRYGLIQLVSVKTPDTDAITKAALAFMHYYGCPASKVCFDRGGGGKQHADRMRAQGHAVQTVSFGESLTPDPKRRGLVETLPVRIDQHETRYEYYNRRAEMYGELSLLLDPSLGAGFAIPRKLSEERLRKQLAVMPKLYTDEGRLKLPPKNKPTPNYTGPTLISLIGHSPDEADALVLAYYALRTKPAKAKAGVH